ncbi:SLC25A46 [Branchiostoma lanceolatum]|uniref:SLC25A46 protein n=1 Tax=Branchiostoma lanceolatum TaxID=7740 RepID=A0A8K0END6_BRALA|nr:SLC25A46 [Branchiostoma lanceolatum]
MTRRTPVGGDREGLGAGQGRTGDEQLSGDENGEAQQRVLRDVDMGTPKQYSVVQMQRFAGFGVGLASLLTENVLSHPCIVFRRQCQVHHCSYRYHLQPFSVLNVMLKIQGAQGFSTVWKGMTSRFVVQGIQLGSEGIIAEFTDFPREVTTHSTFKQVFKHIALKGLSIVVTSPFFCASLIETVQSDIASETPWVLDCVKEGFRRLLGWGAPTTTRLLPVWKLVLPTVLYGLLHYLVTSIVQYIALVLLRQGKDRHKFDIDEPLADRNMLETYFPELFATFLGNLFSDVLLFPLETVMHRLHIQGTRTIIDNTDWGSGVLAINTRYEGMSECFRIVVREEGFFGLYKGFGALILQYLLHAAILKITKCIYDIMSENFPSRPKAPPRQRQQ